MANSKSQQYEIIKNGPLCLDKFCADINEFGNGFNKKNSPYLGGAITNVYSKKNDWAGYYSNGDHEVYLDNSNNIILDNENIGSVENKKFVIEYVKDGNGNNITKNEYIEYINENNYLYISNNNLIIKLNGTQFTETYNPSALYKIARFTSEINAFIKIIKEYSTDSYKFKVFVRTSSAIIINNEIVTDSIPIVSEEYIYLNYNFLRSNNKGYLYLQGLKKNYESFTEDYITENITKPKINSYNYTFNIHKKIGLYSNVLLELDFSNNTYKKVEQVYVDKFSITQNEGTGTFKFTKHVIYPALFYNKIMQIDYSTDYNIDLEVKLVHNTVYHLMIRRSVKSSVNISESTMSNKDVLDDFLVDDSGRYSPVYKQQYVLGYSDSNRKQISDLSKEDDYDRGDISNNLFYSRTYVTYTKKNFDKEFLFLHTIFKDKILESDTYSFRGISALDKKDTNESIFKAKVNDNDNYYFIGGNFVTDDSDTLPNIPHYVTPIRTLTDNPSGHSYFQILLDGNQIVHGISYCKTKKSLGTLITPWDTIDDSMPIIDLGNTILYVDKKGNWRRIRIVNGINISIEDDYLLINTTDTNNAYKLSTGNWTRWAYDWNNRILSNRSDITEKVVTSYSPYSLSLASGINSNIEISDKISSAYFSKNDIVVYGDSPDSNIFEAFVQNQLDFISAYGTDKVIDIELYKDDKYYKTFRYDYDEDEPPTIFEDSDYQNANWSPTVYYNPSIVMKFIITGVDKDIVYFDDEMSVLHYEDGKAYLLYGTSSIIYNYTETAYFSIQGQQYVVQNNRIYSYLIENEAVIIADLICNITGLKYLTFTPEAAYFWSNIDSSLYIFTADNIIKKLYTATEITDIYNAVYYPSCNLTAFSTNLGIICYNDALGMFIIGQVNKLGESDDLTNGELFLNKDGYITYSTGNNVYYFSLWYVSRWIRNNINLSTKFYGVSSNIITITDTWYLRLFADKKIFDSKRDGELKLSVDALTDQGISTETRKIKIKESDWDKLTDTLYIRYQPKLQRGVGISLNIDSPFPIGYLGLGTIPETTQMSRPGMQV